MGRRYISFVLYIKCQLSRTYFADICWFRLRWKKGMRMWFQDHKIMRCYSYIRFSQRRFKHGWISSPMLKCPMKLLVFSRTSTVPMLIGHVIIYPCCIQFSPCQLKGPTNTTGVLDMMCCYTKTIIGIMNLHHVIYSNNSSSYCDGYNELRWFFLI